MKHLKLIFTLFTINFFSVVSAQNPDWLWAKNMGGLYSDGAMDVTAGSTGRIYTVGYFRDTVDFDPGPGTSIMSNDTTNGAIFLSAIDSAGNFLWAKQWNNGVYDNSFSVNTDRNGNVYMSGYYTGLIDFDPGPGTYSLPYIFDLVYYVVKLDSNGNFIWVKAFGGCYNTPVCCSKLDKDGNLYCAGQFFGTRDFDPGTGVSNLTSVGRDIFILKLDSAGNFIWVKQISGTINNWPYAIGLDEATNIFLTGSFSGTTDFNPGIGLDTLSSGTSVSNEDIFIAKYNSSGNYLWAKQIGGPFSDHGKSIAVDHAGNVFTTGDYGSNGPGVDFDPGAGVYLLTDTGFNAFISKLDSSGNFIFAKAIAGVSFTFAKALMLDVDGNVIYTGNFIDSMDADPGAGTYYLAADDTLSDALFISGLDNAGNFLWAESKGGTFHYGALQNSGTNLCADASGNIYFVGNIEDSMITFDSDTLFSNNPSSLLHTDAFIAKMGKLATTVTLIKNSDPSILIFPNPSSGIYTIRNLEDISMLNIFNIHGEKVFEAGLPCVHETSIDLQHQPDGVYFLEVRNKYGNVTTGKIVKE